VTDLFYSRKVFIFLENLKVVSSIYWLSFWFLQLFLVLAVLTTLAQG